MYKIKDQQISTLLQEIKDNLLHIEGATFTMGSNLEQVEACVEAWSHRLVEASFSKESFRDWIMKEYPAHEQSLSSFLASKYPITNAQYRVFTTLTEHTLPESLQKGLPANHPVWGVTLADVQAFTDWLNTQSSDLKFRLPTEAEWEYMAKGNEHREYPYGDQFDEKKGNTVESQIGTTTPVDQYDDYCSEFGICDLAGNVEEWTSGVYTVYPGGKAIIDDLYIALGSTYPILRGGSFIRGGDLARSARRHGPFPAPEYRYTGFRLVADQ